MLILGIAIAVSANDISSHGYGRIKSWVIFPFLYAGLVSYALERSILVIRDAAGSVFLGGLSIGIFSATGIFFGQGMTYDDRIRGYFSSPNQLAMILGMAFLCGFYMWMEKEYDRIMLSVGMFFLLIMIYSP